MADASLRVAGIYAIRNTINGKIYIGSALRIDRRFADHRRGFRNGDHENGRLRNACKKYGLEAFVFELIEVVRDIGELLSREQHWIDVHDAARGGYNISPTAGNCRGTKHTDVARANMAAAHRGKTAPAEVKAKMSASQKGRVHSAEALLKMSIAQRRENQSEETRARRSAAATGRKMSPESIARSTASKVGRKLPPRSEEHKARISAARKAQGNFRTGTTHSEETKAKMRISMKAAKATAKLARELTMGPI